MPLQATNPRYREHNSFPYLNTKEDMMAWLHDEDSQELWGTHYHTWVHDSPSRHDDVMGEADLSLVDKDHNNSILIQFHYGYTNSNSQTTYQAVQHILNPMPIPWYVAGGLFHFP